MRRIFSTLSAFLLVTGFAFTQSQSTSGNIEGRVVDQNGDAVPGISVTLIGQDTGFAKTVQSDGEGTYIFVLIPPGDYKLETSAGRGFASSIYENVKVTVGVKNTLNIVLRPGDTVNVVDVNIKGQGLETTRTSISSTVDETRVINRPSISRSFMDFITLTPGIIRDPARGGDFVVGGQKGSFNSLQVDGASSDNTFFGQSTGRIGTRASYQFSIDAVKEFQVIQNGYSAEFGRAAGAVVNVVTKSGTNRFTGGLFWFFRDRYLNANSPNVKQAQAMEGLPNKRNPGRRNQFGGTFGGPIKKNRYFIFGAYEGQLANSTNFVVLNSLSRAPLLVQNYLRPKIAPYPIAGNQDTFLVRTDLNIDAKNQAWFRFNQQNFRGINMESAGSLVAEEHTGNRNFITSALVVNWTSAITPNWFNEFRFQFSRDREPGFANTNAPEVILMASNAETFLFGRNSSSPNETIVTHHQFIDNQTFLTGRHRVKFGADILIDGIFNFDPSFFAGSYTFPDYASLNDQLLHPTLQFASHYRQNFAGAGTTGPETFPDNREYGLFFQDDLRLGRRLTLDLGVRYDFQKIAKPQIQNPNPTLFAAGFDTSFGPSNTGDFSPRLGISYAFDKKTVIRAGYGIYFGRTPGMMVSGAQSRNGVQVVAIDIKCRTTPAACPVYPAVFASVPTNIAVTPNLYLFDRHYKQPFTHQASFQVEREVSAYTTVSILYTMYRGDNLTRARDANLSAPVPTVVPVYDGLTPTGETFTFQIFSNPRPVVGFGRISLFESTANSFYQGLTFEFNRRFSGWWQLNASYTLSKAKDDKPDQSSILVDGGATLAENQFDLSGEYDRSDLEVRHRFIFSPVFESGRFPRKSHILRALLSNYRLAGIFTAQSGTPYSALVSNDPNNDSNTATDRVPGTRRNEFTTRTKYIIDLRVARTFRYGERYRLTILAEAYNLFNRSNVLTANNTLYKYLNPSGGLPARLSLQATTFGTTHSFLAASQASNASISSYNRETQLGLRFEF